MSLRYSGFFNITNSYSVLSISQATETEQKSHYNGSGGSDDDDDVDDDDDDDYYYHYYYVSQAY